LVIKIKLYWLYGSWLAMYGSVRSRGVNYRREGRRFRSAGHLGFFRCGQPGIYHMVFLERAIGVRTLE